MICPQKYSKNISVIENINYEDFFDNYLLTNTPCMIKNIARQWKSFKLWTQEGKPKFEYLLEKYGKYKVTIYSCNEQYFNSQKTLEMSFDEYVRYWKDYMKQGYPDTLPTYYLKDWHLMNDSDGDDFYEVPLYFTSDWLNEYLTDQKKDDYRFVYMGPKGSWTPFHQDVFSSYSWSANICGKKRWLLFPPGQELKFSDSRRNMSYDLTQIEIDEGTDFIEVIQYPGDAIFIPSGWYHQVWNLDDTISINHNWINGCNIKNVWEALKSNMSDVEKEIKEYAATENYATHCQLILKSTFGIDLEDFLNFLQFILFRRIKSCSKNQTQDTRYVIHDLQSLQHVHLCLKEFLDKKEGMHNVKEKMIRNFEMLESLEQQLL